jgi:beta-galactosidase
MVPYEPGNVTVVGYSATGQIIAVDTVETTGPPAALVLSVDYGADDLVADGQDAALIRVSVVDANGRVVPTASNFITFSSDVSFGNVIGVGNGDPSCIEPDKAVTRSAFNGLARAILQTTTIPGSIAVSASSPGLVGDTIYVTSTAPVSPTPTL